MTDISGQVCLLVMVWRGCAWRGTSKVHWSVMGVGFVGLGWRY